MADEYTPEVSVAFKENLVRLAHTWAEQGRQCETFDQILLRQGLPGRDSFHDERYDWIPRPTLVGEATEEEFEAWKAEIQEYFWQKADEYGIGATADALLQEAGLQGRPQWVEVDTVVEGTFSVPLTVRMREGEDVITRVDKADLGNKVYERLYYGDRQPGDLDWKVRVAEDTPSS